MLQASVSSALHDLAGRSTAFDGVVRFAAQDLIYAALIVALAVWLRPQGLRAGVAAAGGALIGLGAGSLAGDVWNRPRPFVTGQYAPLFAHVDDASFPSDHVLVLGALAGAAWLAWRPAGVATAVLALAVGIARVIAGVHYVGDVAGGFVIGAIAAVLVWFALGVAMPLLSRLDAVLQRLHLRPRVTPAR
ncbi:MAG TPA: phosphatase PAP2 family protein [Candidatus Dormibacteraeota bacterium]|jgi:undecaprenyl-diphosphatase|nr:phosphatase PAP2 family protein [Candidatus Dormibacteraeota bacterium]